MANQNLPNTCGWLSNLIQKLIAFLSNGCLSFSDQGVMWCLRLAGLVISTAFQNFIRWSHTLLVGPSRFQYYKKKHKLFNIDCRQNIWINSWNCRLLIDCAVIIDIRIKNYTYFIHINGIFLFLVAPATGNEMQDALRRCRARPVKNFRIGCSCWTCLVNSFAVQVTCTFQTPECTPTVPPTKWSSPLIKYLVLW